MVKRFFIFVAVISILGAGYFTYEKWVKDANLTLWNFVPDTSIAVYESATLQQTLDHLNNQSSWKNLNLIDGIAGINQSIQFLDSTLGKSDAFIDAFSTTPYLISIHVTSKTELDFLYIVQLPQILQQGILSSLESAFKEASYLRRTREYLGFNITEIISPEGETFTFILYKNYFIGSKSAFLVEDAIRTQAEAEFQNFSVQFPELYSLAKLERDQGNLYFNLDKLDDLLNVFLSRPVVNEIGRSSFMDIGIESSLIELTGFVIPREGDYLSDFSDIVGAPFDLAEIIPNETSTLYHFSFTDPDKWKSTISAKLSPQHLAIKKQYVSEADFDIDYLFELLDQEVAVGWYGEQYLPYLFLEVGNSEEALRFLKNAAERFAQSNGDTLFVENYKDFEIVELPFQQFPNAFMGELPGEFKDCFFVNYRNYLLFADELPLIKAFLDDIEAEGTWGKSVRKNQFLQKSNQEAVFSMFVDVPNSWNTLLTQLNEEWKASLEKNDYIFKNFQNIAIQFNPVDAKFYTNLLIEQSEGDLFETSTENRGTLSLAAPIITKPYLVRNHINGQYEILLQDSSFRLYQISDELKVNWSLPLEAQVMSDFEQIDYYKNQKLQYAFITTDKFHILDRNGEYLPGFPLEINNIGPLTHFSVVDYDGSKKYRFSFTDDTGAIVFADKDGKQLDKWNPMKMSAPLTAPVRHFRIGGTDVFVATLSNGEIHLLSRRGRNYPGFPIKLNEPVSSPYHLKPGSNFASTELSIVTNSGQLVKVNLKGKTLDRNQLLKAEVETSFNILNDVTQKHFLVTEAAADQLVVLTPDGSRLFEKDYLNSQSPFIQFYRISSSQQYLAIGERKGEFIYIYDTNGRLITNRPLQGNNPLSILYFEEANALQVYLASQNELRKIRISR